MSQVSDKDYPQPLMNVLTTCAKILSSSGKISKLVKLEQTKCSASVWKSCRAMLVEKTKKKKNVLLEWLPQEIGEGFGGPKAPGKAPRGDEL